MSEGKKSQVGACASKTSRFHSYTQDSAGNTILHILAPTDATKLIAFLVSNGCKAQLKNNAGVLPLDLATNYVVKTLLNHSPQVCV